MCLALSEQHYFELGLIQKSGKVFDMELTYARYLKFKYVSDMVCGAIIQVKFTVSHYTMQFQTSNMGILIVCKYLSLH